MTMSMMMKMMTRHDGYNDDDDYEEVADSLGNDDEDNDFKRRL